jgi:hypothetical protein
MTFQQDDLYQIASSIWESMLGLPVLLGSTAPAGSDGAPAGQDPITGYVQISGALEVGVLLECPRDLASRLTPILFDADAMTITRNDILDAVGELTNMISGSFKGLLPSPCTLSIPTVIEDAGSVSTATSTQTVATRVVLECEDRPFTITLLVPNARG